MERNLDEFQVTRRFASLQAVADSWLAVEMFRMVLHRVDRHNQILRDLLSDSAFHTQRPNTPTVGEYSRAKRGMQAEQYASFHQELVAQAPS